MASWMCCGCVSLFICAILEAVGLATTYWITATILNDFAHSGLFKACMYDTCVSTFSWDNLTIFLSVSATEDCGNEVHFVGYVSLNCLGGLLQLIGFLYGLSKCNNPDTYSSIPSIRGLCIAAGAFIAGGLSWFYVKVFKNEVATKSDIELGWSFYLCVGSSALSWLLGLALCCCASSSQPRSTSRRDTEVPLTQQTTQSYGGPSSYGQQYPAYQTHPQQQQIHSPYGQQQQIHSPYGQQYNLPYEQQYMYGQPYVPPSLDPPPYDEVIKPTPSAPPLTDTMKSS